MQWEYSFYVWVAPHTTWSQAFLEVLKMGKYRLCKVMTEDEWEIFRSDLYRDGIELKEVERVPYHEPEAVLPRCNF